MKVKPNVTGSKVMTGEVRANYVNVFKARVSDDGEAKYSMCLTWDKDTAEGKATTQAIKTGLKNAMEEDKDGSNLLKGKLSDDKLFAIIHDGDDEREGDKNFAGKSFMNVSSKNKVGIIDADKTEIIDPDDFYSGCYCRVLIKCKAYAVKGKKGVGVYMNAIQKIRDGEHLDGFTDAGSVFDAIDDDDDMSFLD